MVTGGLRAVTVGTRGERTRLTMFGFGVNAARPTPRYVGLRAPSVLDRRQRIIGNGVNAANPTPR